MSKRKRTGAAAGLPAVEAGYVDLQVNGFAGVDFSSPGLTVEAVRRVAGELARRGTAAFCPTVTSTALPVYEANLAVLADAMTEPDLRRRVLGIHIEGPFIAPKGKGAHAARFLRKPDTALFDCWQRLARGGIRILTLAPELPGADALVRHVTRRGVIASLGHHVSDAQSIHRAVAAGATCCTHLGNGIPNMLPRHPNAIWTQLADDRLTGMFITDGHHLPADFVRVAWRVKGAAKFIVTSDSAPIAGLPPGRYNYLGGRMISEPGGRLVMADGQTLAGSSATMSDCMRWLKSLGILSRDDLRRVGRLNALALLKTAQQRG